MYAQINNHQIWYDTAGEDGVPVLLVMGFGMSGRAWAPQIAGLRERHRVAFYDHRGIGDSEVSQTPYGFQQLAADAIALMDVLEWETAHVVGVSMGGMVSQHIALRHRRRVRSLSLIATHAGGGGLKAIPTAKGLRHFVKANTSRGETRINNLRHLLYPNEFLDGADFSHFGGLDDFAEPADPKTLLYQLRAIMAHNTGRELRKLKGLPTLVVKPARDLLVKPRNSDRIHRLIPGSRLLSFKDAGHAVTHQYAAEVNRHLAAHFQAAEEGL